MIHAHWNQRFVSDRVWLESATVLAVLLQISLKLLNLSDRQSSHLSNRL